MIGSVLLVAAAAGLTCPPQGTAGMVTRSAPFGGAIVPTAKDADEAVAAGTLASAAAHRFMKLRPPPFVIADAPLAARLTPGDCAFVFPWPFSRFRTEAFPPPSHVLPHEICHALFIRFIFPRSDVDEYGGAAPDWLDEMAAIACEDANGVRMRRSETRRHAERSELIPMHRFLSMPHPEWSARQKAPDATAAMPPKQPGSVETPAFYATVRALFDFLLDRTGNVGIIRVLADQVRAGVPVEKWLLAHVARHPEQGLAGLDAEITGFVLTNPIFVREARG
jgi:hypothetical protein